jgi:hypothetical protein
VMDLDYETRVIRSAMNSIRDARRREDRKLMGASVTITAAEIVAILKRQNFRCALSGMPFWWQPQPYSPTMPSIDRINHAGPYSAGNVRVVCYGLNGLRGNGSDADMYSMAEALLANRASLRRAGSR